jgi:hypothetical protein
MIVIGTETAEHYFATHRGARGISAARSQYDVWGGDRPACAMAPP